MVNELISELYYQSVIVIVMVFSLCKSKVVSFFFCLFSGFSFPAAAPLCDCIQIGDSTDTG